MQGVGDETQLSEKAKELMYFSYLYSNKISKQELISNENTTIGAVFFEFEEAKIKKSEMPDILVRSNKIIHYKNYGTNIYRLESEKIDRNLIKKNISIKDSIPDYKWNLVNESQTVAGYLCKKATTTKNVGSLQTITAGYCEDIPLNDGPMDFSGLPGLILQIEIGNNTVVKFENIKLLNDVHTDIKEPKNETETLTISDYVTKMINGG